MLGREVIERQQRLAILLKAFGGLFVFDRVAFDEGVECGLGVGFLVSAIQMSSSVKNSETP